MIPAIEELTLLHEQICQAVGDPRRIQILYALHENPRNVTALAEALEIPQPTTSRHLALLRQRALVVAEREGPNVIYRVRDPRIIDILDLMRQLLRDALENRTNTMSF